jgi:thiamine-monophosphate kinase
VGATIEAEQIPTDPKLGEVARELAVDPLRLCLSGGEDYELLFTSPASEVADDLAVRIGQIQAQPGIRIVDGAGDPVALELGGYEHFRQR